MKKVAKVTKNRRALKSPDLHVRSKYNRPENYHPHITTKQVMKLMDYQNYLFRDKEAEKEQSGTRKLSRSADSLTLASSKMNLKSKPKRRASANDPAPVMTSKPEEDDDSSAELIKVIHELFKLTHRIPGLMFELLGEDYNLDNLVVDEYRVYKKAPKRKSMAKKSIRKSYPISKTDLKSISA